mgnify:CR=1 FL=1
MSRRTRAERRETQADPRFESTTVTKFINALMLDGKKSLAEKIFYDALEIVEEKSGQPGLNVFRTALTNAKPALEVKSRRVGGATYQVPIEVRPERRSALAIRWIIGCPAAWGEEYGSTVGSGVHGGQPWRRIDGQEEGRHPSDGGGKQGVRALSLVRKNRSGSLAE